MIRLVGAVTLESAGRPGTSSIELGPLGQAALGYLLLERHRTVHRDELAEALWGEALPATWRDSLRGVIARVRRALGDIDGFAVTVSSGTYHLRVPDDAVVDVELVEHHLRAAEQATGDGDPVRSRTHARQATDFADGEFLPCATGDWVEQRRAELRELHVRGLEALSEAASGCGDHPTALRAANAAVRLAPLRESAHLRLMLAHAAGGERVEALRVYHRCRHLLADELGISPASSMQDAYVRLLSADDAPESAAALPASVDSFVGRTSELRSVRKSLAAGRLVTLTGPAGVGKSRLALEVARDVAPEYPHGAHLVELAELADPAGLPHHVLTVLGVPPAQGQAPLEALRAWIGGRRLLLLLDNCERVVDSCAALTTALLEAAPNLSVVATSRQRLGIAGESVWEVAPLPTPNGRAHARLEDLLQYEAVRLFMDRATAAAAGLEADPAALAQVCDRLEGLPLAIELAAARARTLDLPEIADRLDDRFRLLASARSPGVRHHTLRAAVDCSYETLSEEERTLLLHLAVFAGGFGLDAVESVCSDAVPDVVDVLSRLVDKSLVAVRRRSGGNRYHLLETIRAYAGERVRGFPGEPEIRERHAGWAGRLAMSAGERLDGPEHTCALQVLETEHRNIAAALRWLSSVPQGREPALRMAVSIWRYWEARGHLEEGRSWLEGLARSGGLPASLRADGLNAAAILAHQGSDLARARRLYHESLTIRQRAGDLVGVTAARNGLAHLRVSEGAYTDAQRLFQQNLVVAEGLDDERLVAGTLMNLGVVEQLLWAASADRQPSGRDHARMLLRQAHARYQALGNVRGMALCLENLGSLALLDGQAEQGRSALHASLAARQTMGDKLGLSECLRFLGQSALGQHEYGSSRRYLQECAELWRQIGNPRRTAEVLGSLAELAHAQGDAAQARTHLRESVLLYCRLADQHAAGDVLERLEDMIAATSPRR